MGKKGLSLILVPTCSGSILRKRISVGLAAVGGGAVLLFLLWNAFLSWSFFNRVSQEARISGLERENSLLSSELGSLEGIVDSLQSEIDKLVEKEEAIRAVFGLPEVDQEIRQLGVGGQDYPQPVHSGASWGETFEEIRSGIDRLYRRVKFENESLEHIYAEVTDRKQLLDHTPSIRPTEGCISRGFGMRPDPFTGWIQFHQGIDFAAPRGTPVYATADGRVTYTGWSGGLGKIVRIDHNFGHSTLYGHLDNISVRKGQRVERGQLIGSIGSTGYSTGPHLHYEVRHRGQRVDPRKFIYSLSDFALK